MTTRAAPSRFTRGCRRGDLVLCDNCTKTIEALEPRIHDPDHENDVLKVSGEDLDDYYDSFRYGWKSFETARQVTTPTRVRIEELLKERVREGPDCGDVPRADGPQFDPGHG
jgi:hypothetical protein